MNKLKKLMPANGSHSISSRVANASLSPSAAIAQNQMPFKQVYHGVSNTLVQASCDTGVPYILPVAGKDIADTWTASSSPADMKPRTYVEQYWAARALTAETMLSTRTYHERELASLKLSEEAKRSREIALLMQAHETRQDKLEKCVAALIACIVFLAGMVTYMVMKSSHCVTTHASWWLPPSHFTIPILSPFTSVVEHETSVVGTKTVAVIVVLLCGLAYAIFRYWYQARPR